MGSGRVRIAEEFSTNVLRIAVVNDEMEQKVIDTIRRRAAILMEKSLCQN